MNAPEEAWISAATGVAYVFPADGKLESYSLEDGTYSAHATDTWIVQSSGHMEHERERTKD